MMMADVGDDFETLEIVDLSFLSSYRHQYLVIAIASSILHGSDR